jgi:hypothetical protein
LVNVLSIKYAHLHIMSIGFALSIKKLYAILLKHVFSLFSLDDVPPME